PVKVAVIDGSGNEIDDSQYITFDDLNATVLANTQTIKVRVTQQEGDSEGEDWWFSKTEEYTIEIRHNPIHVGNLCDVSLVDLWKSDGFTYSMSPNVHIDDATSYIVVGGTAGSSTGGYVVFHFEGTPDKLTLDKYASNSSWTWSIQQSNTPNDEGFHDLNAGDTFDADARYLKISISGDKANGEIRSLCITEKVGIDASPSEVSLVPVQDASGTITNISMGQFSVTPYNLEKAVMTITGTNAADFELVCGSHPVSSTITLDAADGLGVDRNPTVSVHVRYIGDLTSAVDKTATVHIHDEDDVHSVDIVLKVIKPVVMNEYGVPSSICAGMATTTGIETGTEHATNNTYPYHRKTSVDLTGAFIGGAAYFDALYIFGVTKGYTKDGTSTMSVGRYSKTPCYVYVKTGDCYTFSRCVENMNSETKNIGIGITASGQKLYFTGWCPYASTGRVSSDNGVFHITGGAGAKVDIYLDECYMYARSKLIREDQDANYAQTDNVASTSFGDYPTGSGGVFVLQTSSTSADNPFQPTIHLRRNNVLQSTTGSYVQVSAMGVTKNATQCSSPVHMYTTSTDQYETLTIDDKWPDNATTSSTTNTNGALQLRKTTNGSPSIDLGNEHSVVNINGGQITLSNSVPQSASYSSTMALSWRKYSQSVLGINFTIYGVGNDQASGAVNFNDGTISAVPIDKNSTVWKTYQSYYWDNVSLKCPQNTHVNGGSYNCNIYVCKSYDDKGASPTDKKGTALCKWDVKTTGTNENGTAIYTFPNDIRLSDDVSYNSLGEYYTRNGFEYGRSSITADEAGKVNLLLPCGYVGKEPQEGVTIVSWAMCLPSLTGKALGKEYQLGGDINVVSDKKNEVSYLLWTEVDENIHNAVNGYKTPPFVKGNDQSTGTVTFKDEDNYKSITNTTSYVINQELRIIKPAVADVWMTFTAPFNVQTMYVLESYPESVLQQKSRSEALQLQAQANLDYSFYLVSEVKVSEEPSPAPYTTFYNSWLQYEYGQDTTGTNPVYPAEKRTVKGKDGNMYYPRSVPSDYIQNYRGQRELVAYDGANWDKANFYLYEPIGDTWSIAAEDETPVTQWKFVEPAEDGTLLQQGHTYSMLFPYCTGCWTEDEKTQGRTVWDYWSGKLLVFEGAGPATIAGTNYHTSLLSTTPSANEVAVMGNATLAALTTNSSSVWTYEPVVGEEGFVPNNDNVTINPTEAFLIGDIPATAGKVARRINMLTGKVEYEYRTPTGVPTIN
ncbi:MAG TPA: hypothetical protein DIW30_02565, partial [Bacteroidales bacterium]|nr:hypothetical protein [Bacteroidales bacterium]